MELMEYPKEITKYPAWKELVDKAGTWEYGTFHSREEIADILMTTIGTHKYSYGISMANKNLLKLGKTIDSVHGKGYIVMEPKNYIKKSNNYCNRGRTSFRKALEHLVYAPIESLTTDEQKLYNQAIDSTSRLVVMTEAGIKENQTLQKNYLLINSARG